MTRNRFFLATTAVALLVAGCSPASSTPTPTPSADELPLVLTASGFVLYPKAGADCTAGNLVKKGDPIELVDPSGTVVDTSKLIDAIEVKDDAGKPICQSGFALNQLHPSQGTYTIKLGTHTLEKSTTDIQKTIFWTLS